MSLHFGARKAAIESLEQIGRGAETVAALLVLAQDAELESQERRLAAEALGRLGCEGEATEIWLDLAHDPQTELKDLVEIAEALECLGPGQANEAAEIWLKVSRNDQERPEERQTAIKKLERLGRGDSLLTVAKDVIMGSEVQSAATEALERLGQTDKLFALAQNAGAGARMRQRAGESLERLGQTEKAAEAWLMMISDTRLREGEQRFAAKKMGRLAEYLSAEKGHALVRFTSHLNSDQKSHKDILQNLVWGFKKAQWANPQSATWLLLLIEGRYEGQEVYQPLRDAAWEALSQLASLVDQTDGSSF